MTGSNPTDRSKLGTKRHILTDKNGIPMSAVITSANTHDIKAVTDVIDNAVIKQQQPTPSNLSTKIKAIKQHLCLDRAYNSKAVEQEIIKRGYVPHMPYKRKREEGKRTKIKHSKKGILQESDG
jgi:DDE family transposase